MAALKKIPLLGLRSSRPPCSTDHQGSTPVETTHDPGPPAGSSQPPPHHNRSKSHAQIRRQSAKKVLEAGDEAAVSGAEIPAVAPALSADERAGAAQANAAAPTTSAAEAVPQSKAQAWRRQRSEPEPVHEQGNGDHGRQGGGAGVAYGAPGARSRAAAGPVSSQQGERGKGEHRRDKEKENPADQSSKAGSRTQGVRRLKGGGVKPKLDAQGEAEAEAEAESGTDAHPKVGSSGHGQQEACSSVPGPVAVSAACRAWQDSQAFSLSLDLVRAARHYLCILRAVHAFPSLACHQPTVARSVRRYLKCWLPLLAKAQEKAGQGKASMVDAAGKKQPADGTVGAGQPGSDDEGHAGSNCAGRALFPPLDVLWVWVCHRLSPAAYSKHCRLRFGRVLECPPEQVLVLGAWALREPQQESSSASRARTMPELQAVEESMSWTRRLWEKLFPKDPYDLDLPWPPTSAAALGSAGSGAGGGAGPKAAAQGGAEASSLGKKAGWTEDVEALEGRVLRQGAWVWQVLRRHFWEPSFLGLALERYKAFLYLMRRQRRKHSVKAPEPQELLPTVDIELIWQTHCLCPLLYSHDTVTIFGNLLDRSDMSWSLPSSPRRAICAPIHDGHLSTAAVWEAEFGSAYGRGGCMGTEASPEALPLWMAAGLPLSVAAAQLQNFMDPHSASPRASPTRLLLLPGPPPRADLAIGISSAMQAWAGSEYAEARESQVGLQPRGRVHAAITVQRLLEVPAAMWAKGRLMRIRVLCLERSADDVLGESELLGEDSLCHPLNLCLSGCFELDTRGLRFVVQQKSRQSLWRNQWKDLGCASVEWGQVLRCAGHLLQATLPITAVAMSTPSFTPGASSRKALEADPGMPLLHLSISVTPPEPSPSLLAMAPITPDWLGEPQRGGLPFWVQCAVLDHDNRERFMCTLKHEEDMDAKKRLRKVQLQADSLWEGTMELRMHTTTLPDDASNPPQGQGQRHRDALSTEQPAPAPLVARAELKTAQAGRKHHWKLCYAHHLWNVTVTATIGAEGQGQSSTGDLLFSLDVAAGSDLAILVRGRVLEYSMKTGPASLDLEDDEANPAYSKDSLMSSGRFSWAESRSSYSRGPTKSGASTGKAQGSFMTILRFPPETGSRGMATALLNLTTGIVEVAPGEQVHLVFLLAAALGISVPMLRYVTPNPSIQAEGGQSLRQSLKNLPSSSFKSPLLERSPSPGDSGKLQMTSARSMPARNTPGAVTTQHWWAFTH